MSGPSRTQSPFLRISRGHLALGLTTLLALGGLVLVACSSGGEGDRCQLDNDNPDKTNDDCGEGLVCTPAKDLPIDPIYRGQVRDREGRCCPTDRNRATVAECKQTPPAPGGDASIPADAATDGSPSTDGGTDAPVDATSDAPSEAATDAAVDAPSDANEAG